MSVQHVRAEHHYSVFCESRQSLRISFILFPFFKKKNTRTAAVCISGFSNSCLSLLCDITSSSSSYRRKFTFQINVTTNLLLKHINIIWGSDSNEIRIPLSALFYFIMSWLSDNFLSPLTITHYTTLYVRTLTNSSLLPKAPIDACNPPPKNSNTMDMFWLHLIIQHRLTVLWTPGPLTLWMCPLVWRGRELIACCPSVDFIYVWRSR